MYHDTKLEEIEDELYHLDMALKKADVICEQLSQFYFRFCSKAPEVAEYYDEASFLHEAIADYVKQGRKLAEKIRWL